MDDKTCIVVVDMVNGFVKEGALSDPGILKIVPAIKNILDKAVDNGSTIINFQDSHEENSKEFEVFPKHCIKGTYESLLIDELIQYEDKMITLKKNSTNGFMQPEFLNIFNNLDCKKYIIVGCCTDICVLQFALSLKGYVNQNNLDIEVIVIEDAVDTFETDGHLRSECNANSLNILKGAGIKILKEGELSL
ncbi:MAG: isochorismatase family cysteine hydrolase [Anaerorhabdus sp.]